MPIRIGLTGGIGSGKSTVAAYFAELGATTIAADPIAHQLLHHDTPQYAAILHECGRTLLTPDGDIDRARLADIIFTNPARRRAIEAILHPPIRQQMWDECARATTPYCILEIPLLIETGQYRAMQRVIVVTCPDPLRLTRLTASRPLDPARIQRIINLQLSDSQRRAYADDLITNDTDLAALHAQVAQFHAQYLHLTPTTPTQ